MVYEWRGEVGNEELKALHADGFGHEAADHDWVAQLRSHSLGWVCAREAGQLVGFLNVAWDGASHAFILDTLVARRCRHRGIGTALVSTVSREAAAGCEWLHVDFDDHHQAFYLDACGFVPTNAGLLKLRGA